MAQHMGVDNDPVYQFLQHVGPAQSFKKSLCAFFQASLSRGELLTHVFRLFEGLFPLFGAPEKVFKSPCLIFGDFRSLGDDGTIFTFHRQSGHESTSFLSNPVTVSLMFPVFEK